MYLASILLQTLVQLNPLSLTVYPSTLQSMEDRLKELCAHDVLQIKERLSKKLEEEVKQVIVIYLPAWTPSSKQAQCLYM